MRKSQALVQTLLLLAPWLAVIWLPGWNDEPAALVGAAAASGASLLWARVQRHDRSLPLPSAVEWPEALRVSVFYLLGAAALTVLLRLLLAEPYDTLRLFLWRRPSTSALPWLARRLALAALQQWALQRFVRPRLLLLSGRGWVADTGTAAIFAVFHLPSPGLAALSFFAGLATVRLFQRTGRLAPVVGLHVCLWAFAFIALPERITWNVKVGYEAWQRRELFLSLQEEANRRILRHVCTQGYWRSQGANPEGFVRALYRHILCRTPSDHEVAYWVDRMAWEPPEEVAKKFVVSQELQRLRQQGGYRFPCASATPP